VGLSLVLIVVNVGYALTVFVMENSQSARLYYYKVKSSADNERSKEKIAKRRSNRVLKLKNENGETRQVSLSLRRRRLFHQEEAEGVGEEILRRPQA